ncbi:hypothetical protein [Bradyrhizobium sp.]|uniref:hypothetical protein n=1 Tax=Bradyrhizobium sp. TaxID=376 RepID=UPI003C19A92D
MIWLSTVSLAAGGILAQRFKIFVLAPATIVVVVVTITLGVTQASGVWATILMMAAASVAIQMGYFLGMLIQFGMGRLLASKSSCFSDTGTARNPRSFKLRFLE